MRDNLLKLFLLGCHQTKYGYRLVPVLGYHAMMDETQEAQEQASSASQEEWINLHRYHVLNIRSLFQECVASIGKLKDVVVLSNQYKLCR